MTNAALRRLSGAAAVLFVCSASAFPNEASDASYKCKGFIERSLDNPRSTDLSDWRKAVAYREKNGELVVLMSVKVRNADNSLRTFTMECRVIHQGDDWRLVGLRNSPGRLIQR